MMPPEQGFARRDEARSRVHDRLVVEREPVPRRDRIPEIRLQFSSCRDLGAHLGRIDLNGAFADYAIDPHMPVVPRDPVTDHVTFAFVGGGFAVQGGDIRE